MSHSIAPALRPDVIVRPFDAGDDIGERRFVVAVDGRHFLVTAAVAAVLEASRQPASFAAVAERASRKLGVSISADQVARLFREQIPAALPRSSSVPESSRSALWCRWLIVSGPTLEPILKRAASLFRVNVAVAIGVVLTAIAMLVALCGRRVHTAPLTGMDVVVAFALTIVGVFVHELGHLAACVRHGAPHGGIGCGMYWCFPTLYSEVHGAWLLRRHQRALVDIGGIYFQSAYMAALGALYLWCGSAAVLDALVWSQVLMLHTLNPVLKFDGYWLLTDLTGSRNLHQRIRSIARRVWRLVVRRPVHRLPSRSELVLLAVFATAAALYFAYLLIVLGNALGSTTAAILASRAFTDAFRNAALLMALLLMTLGVSLLIARSLSALVQEDSDVP